AFAVVGAERKAALCLTGHLRSAARDAARLFVEPLRHVVLGPLRRAGYDVDVFAVTDAGEDDCEQTRTMLRPLNLQALHCVPAVDVEDVRRREERWLSKGPHTVWDRQAFLGQLKKVRVCDELLEQSEQPYRLVARSRMDARWHRFPEDARQLEVPGVIWLPLRSVESTAQYMSDQFAIGRYPEMRAYLRVYDEALDRGQWKLYRSFESTPDGLDTEELWQVSLLKAGVIARQHREICFNLLAKKSSDPWQEREDNCRHPELHRNGYITDTAWYRVPLATLPGMFSFDVLFTMRLLHLFFAEWTRIGRPAKVLDLGCGRATMIERWLKFHPASIAGVDMLPGLRKVLGHDLLELDLSQRLELRDFTSTRTCKFVDGLVSLRRVLAAAEAVGMTTEEAFQRKS
ncbi:unnamed protein product, partial [Effrenium voratum]